MNYNRRNNVPYIVLTRVCSKNVNIVICNSVERRTVRNNAKFDDSVESNAAR